MPRTLPFSLPLSLPLQALVALKPDDLQAVYLYYYCGEAMMCWLAILLLRMWRCGEVDGMVIASEQTAIEPEWD